MALLNRTARTCLDVFTYLTIFTVVVIATTIVLHELGHFFVGVGEGCDAEIILLSTESAGTFTRLECNSINNPMLLYSSACQVVIPFAASFIIFFRGLPERNFGLMILGVGVFSASHDMMTLTGLEAASFLSFIVGIIIYTTGQFLLAERAFVRFEEKILRGNVEW